MNGRGEWVENGRNKESYRNLLWIGTRVVSEIVLSNIYGIISGCIHGVNRPGNVH